MYFSIYKVTNEETGMEYIGRHKTDNLDDGYMGSGTLISDAVEENPHLFKKEILFLCSSEEEMIAKEAEIVTEEYLLTANTYNVIPGGNISLGEIGKWSRIKYSNGFSKPKPTKIQTVKINGKYVEYSSLSFDERMKWLEEFTSIKE